MPPLYFNSYTEEGRMLSNFYQYPLVLMLKSGPLPFMNAESAYQLLKYAEITKERAAFFQDVSGTTAKAQGKKIPKELMRPDWDEVKVRVMEAILKAKFKDGPCENALLKTKGRTLYHLASWDGFWGVKKEFVFSGDTENDSGENMLGKLLMHIRDQKILKTGVEPEYKLIPVKEDTTISKAVFNATRKPFVLGSGYYEIDRAGSLLGLEKVAAYDTKLKKLYSGVPARAMLGLPITTGQREPVRPEHYPDYKVFFQALYIDAYIPRDTTVLYIPQLIN